jgi:hypothetical protein
MQTSTTHTELVGSYRRFGHDGPVYHVLEKIDTTHVKIIVVETDETLSYPIQKALQDPLAE